MEEYRRYAGESEQAYIYRICSLKETIGTWDNVRDILNHSLNHQWTESAYRKKYQEIVRFLEDNRNKDLDFEGKLEDLRRKEAEIQRQLIKLQTEKLEYNRWQREVARDELFEEKVIETIEKTLDAATPPQIIKTTRHERCSILNIADCHFGADFELYGINGDILNKYSPEIFYSRMERLFTEVVEYVQKEDIKLLKIFNLGDSLDGFLRHSQIWTLRYGVIDSAIVFADYMGKWLYALSNYVGVEYNQTHGNHGELRLLDGKKNQHSGDNIEKITGHIIRMHNKDNPNFEYIENKSGFIFTEAAGFNVLGIHGEVKDMEQALKDYSMIYNTPIDYLISGHKHHTNFNNCGVGKGCIGIGSIIGSDDYSIKLRKAADATASLITFEKNKGKVDDHTFVLNE